MDDENPLHPGEKSPVSRPAVPELSSRSNTIPLRGAKSIFDDEPHKTPESHRLRSPSMQFSNIHASPSDKATPKTMPWNALSPSPGRPGLKEIMAEASDARTPAPFFGSSPGSFPRRREVSSSGGNFPSKLSQKERKKMKQQQLQEAPEQKNQKLTPSSPWQPIPKPKLDDHPDDRQAASPSGARVSLSRPAMTLRQTVAGTPPPPPPPQAQQLTNLNPKLVSPSPDTTDTNSVTTARNISITPNKSFSQSSRADPGYGNSAHSFEATSPSPSLRQSRLSLASILEQQQVEKDEIREAATAKHNLHDIQVEQEFQEWWDQESKRVMMMQEAEVAEAAATAQRSSARGKGRGGGSAGKWKGRGGGGGNAAHHGQRRNNNALPPVNAGDDTTSAHRGGGGGGEKKRNSDRGRGQRSTSIGARGRGARRGGERGKERGHH